MASTDPDALNPAPGTFVGNTLEWDSMGSPFVGELISVALIRVGGNGQGAFDNVRITAVDIPEPATLLIWLLLAGLGIGAGWRRRGG